MNWPSPLGGNNALHRWLNHLLAMSKACSPIASNHIRPSITPDGTSLQVNFPPGPIQQPLHPFQLYKLNPNQVADADKGKSCYSIRSGYLEMRPQWTNLSGGSVINLPGNYSFYADESGGGSSIGGGTFGDAVENVSPAAKLGFEGQYFTVDLTPELDGLGANYGSYYAFYIEIADSTPAVSPVLQIKSRRFSIFNPSPGGYPLLAFPASTISSTGIDTEIIPIAILQAAPSLSTLQFVTPAAGVGVLPLYTAGAGMISQLLRDHLTKRYDPLGLRYQGDFDPRQYRMYYPGDVVFFDAGGDDTDFNYGYWRATAIGQNGGAVTDPTGSAAGFVYWSNPNPPTATNPP